MANKKGIMLKFLVTVLLAILIFLPTCLFVSKFFRLSDQAQNSFENLVEVLQQMPNSAEKSKQEILILDKNTFLIGYNANQGVELCPGIPDQECVNSKYPSECGGKTCLCLCQNFKEAEVSEGETIPCQYRICQKLEGINFADNLKISNLYLDEEAYREKFKGGYFYELHTGSYFKKGFLSGRGSFKFGLYHFDFSPYRRQFFHLNVLDNNKICLTKLDGGCQFKE